MTTYPGFANAQQWNSYKATGKLIAIKHTIGASGIVSLFAAGGGFHIIYRLYSISKMRCSMIQSQSQAANAPLTTFHKRSALKPWFHVKTKQEGQHPLTGQRAPPISGGT